MITSEEIKQLAQDCGADLCGIAPIDRFTDAPKGFHPTDIYSECESVIALAKRLPIGVIYAETCIPYTFASNRVLQEMEQITVDLSRCLDDRNILNVPVPPDDPYE